MLRTQPEKNVNPSITYRKISLSATLCTIFSRQRLFRRDLLLFSPGIVLLSASLPHCLLTGLSLLFLSACGAPAPLPAPPGEIRVVGHNFAWKTIYPGPDGVWDTPDDRVAGNEIHLPEAWSGQLVLISEDFIYTFSAPELDIHEVAVPGAPLRLQITTGSPKQFPYRGDQFCGFTHAQLSGKIVVDSRSAFAQWLAGGGD